VLKSLLKKIHGIDLEVGAVELAAFSLCLALCDALEPETIRASIKLFPLLAGKTLHESCFFDAKEHALVKEPIGIGMRPGERLHEILFANENARSSQSSGECRTVRIGTCR
jgi:hypothetical protein